MAATTVYIPAAGWPGSGAGSGQKMYLRLDYETSGNTTTVSVTPYFSGNLLSAYVLVKGKIQYSTDGGNTKTTLWDFSQKTIGNNYPYSAPLASSTKAAITRVAGSADDWPTTKTITITHSGTVTVTFYTTDGDGVQSAYSAEIAFKGSESITFAADTNPVYLYVDGAWQAHEAYIYEDGAWKKHRPYIYLNGQWVPHG